MSLDVVFSGKKKKTNCYCSPCTCWSFNKVSVNPDFLLLNSNRQLKTPLMACGSSSPAEEQCGAALPAERKDDCVIKVQG